MSEPAAEQPATTAPKQEAKGGGKLLLIILGVLMVVGAFFLQTIMIFVLIGLLPSIVAFIVDKTNNNSVFQTVFFCNLAGIFPYVGQLLTVRASPAETFVMMGDPIPWLAVYSAAALGWVLVGAMPLLLRGVLGFMYVREIEKLESIQAQLKKDWGDEVGKTQ